MLFDLCNKLIDEDDLPPNFHIFKRHGDNRIESDADADAIIRMFTLLDEAKEDIPRFAAIDASRLFLFKPSNVNLCFRMTSVEDF